MAGSHVDLSELQSSELQAIVDRATAGDRDAAASLIDGLAPVVRRRIARALAKRRGAHGRCMGPDLEDLVQDTFARLFDDRGRALRAWNPGRGLGFFGFVGLLAEREVGMVMRTRKRNPWTEEPMAEDALSSLRGATANLAVHIEARDQLRRLFARLRERLSGPGRSYFQSLVVEERSIPAVAQETGASPQALYAWRTRLTRMLREIQCELEVDPGSSAPRPHAESARLRCRRARSTALLAA